VEKAYQSVVPVSVRKGEKLPTRVICSINPISPSTLQVPLSTIQTVTRQQTNTSQGGNTFFAMSNSVYYPDETDAESTPRIAVDVPETALFPTEAKAQEAFTDDALKDNIVTIHVERYASKLEFSAGPVSEYKTGTRIYNATAYDNKEVTLEFIPEYWALNAEATDTYVIKSFREQSTDGQVLPANYTYGRLDRYINITDPENYDAGGTLPNATKWDWNNPDYHRSYWAMSPAYFQDEYPEVSADLKDIDDIKQKYIAYNELDKLGFKASDTNPHYFLETTVGSMALSTTNPAAAVASVIYVGKYKLSLGGTPLADNTPCYTYLSGKVNGIEEERPYIYFDNKLN
ncbi:MAG: hypothetical protein K2K29_02750, partial [Muribaculaceae bacterium]|nr:hypothetical protein [Muribaculaceae bacterium]